MRKILSLLFILIYSYTFAQPVVNRAGAANTVSDARLQSQYNLFVPRYQDTVSANLQRGIDSCGALIYTYDYNGYWYRQCSPKKWVQMIGLSPSPTRDTLVWSLGGNTVGLRQATPILGTLDAYDLNLVTNGVARIVIPQDGVLRSSSARNKYLTYDTLNKQLYYGDGGTGSSYTFNQGLTESGGTVKLGGTISESRQILGTGGGSLYIDSLIYFIAGAKTWPDRTALLSYSNNAAIQYRNQNNIHNEIGLTTSLSYIRSGLATTDYSFFKTQRTDSSARIMSISKKVFIDSINTVSSTTGRKVLVHDTATGRVERVDPATLVTTPTLQQVLASGSTLTSANTINMNGNSFYLTNGSKSFIEIDLTPNLEYAEFGASNASTANFSKTLYALSNVDAQFVNRASTQFGEVKIDGDVNATTRHIVYTAAEHKFSNKTGFGMTTPDHPDSTVHIKGGLRIENGTQGAGKVLTSDANGGASWQTPASVSDTSYTTIATFTAGGGFASDTTMCTDSTLFGSFYTGQFDYTIAYVQAVIKGNAGDSIVLKLVYNDTFNVDGTKVNGAGLSVNNRYTGNTFTISTNRTVPANTWLWMKPEAVITGKKPKYISVTLVGYKTYVAP